MGRLRTWVEVSAKGWNGTPKLLWTLIKRSTLSQLRLVAVHSEWAQNLFGSAAAAAWVVSASGRNEETTMLKLIEGSKAQLFPQEMDAMFRNRAEIFSDRLGWEVVVKDGYERDQFDGLNPLYLVSVDPVTNQYWGSLRLLPTTGPNMLRDVFPQLLEEGEVVESATIWESSRICAIAAPGQPDRCKNGVGYVLSELIAGIGEVAYLAGLTQIVSVFDARILRVLKAVGCEPEVIGTPKRIGGVMAYAAMFEPDFGRLEAFRTEMNMGDTVLAPGAKELVFA
jgi:acyl homoserine lactone synthase